MNYYAVVDSPPCYPSWYTNNDEPSMYSSQPELTSSPKSTHQIVALPQASLEQVEMFIVQRPVEGKLGYCCKIRGCKNPNKIFMSKENARVHVQHELGYQNLYMCLGCDTQFSSRDTAKRHAQGKLAGKQHPCRYCGAFFERKDYRSSHETNRKCRQSRTADICNTRALVKAEEQEMALPHFTPSPSSSSSNYASSSSYSPQNDYDYYHAEPQTPVDQPAHSSSFLHYTFENTGWEAPRLPPAKYYTLTKY